MAAFHYGFIVACAIALAGCSQSSSAPDGAKGGASAGPEKAVEAFLQAVKKGDDAQAEALLTPTAKQKTKQAGLDVAPPASDTAQFQVGQVEIVGPGAAHVGCELTDLDDSGQPHTSKIVWMLREEANGWRIAGMATKVFDDQPPVILNFEDPDDMVRKQKLVEEEAVRRATGQAEQATGQKKTMKK
jgi:hypothetical protein